jgi:hypothetical protein
MIRPGPDHLLTVAATRPRTDDEHFAQRALMLWAAGEGVQATHPELAALFAVPNFSGFVGSKEARLAAGARAKAEGRKAGVPDLVLPAPRGGYAALYLEMKDQDGRVRPEQRTWHARLRSLGNKVEVHRSWERAREAILAYLALPVTAGIHLDVAA